MLDKQEPAAEDMAKNFETTKEQMLAGLKGLHVVQTVLGPNDIGPSDGASAAGAATVRAKFVCGVTSP